MNNDLISEVEEFLAEGGEQADLDALLEKYREVALDPAASKAWYEGLTAQEQMALREHLHSEAMHAVEEFRASMLPCIEAMAEALTDIVTAMLDVVRAAARIMWEQLEPLREWVRRFTERCRRETLAHKLRRWGVPERVAVWLANWWPARWLPAMVLPPP